MQWSRLIVTSLVSLLAAAPQTAPSTRLAKPLTLSQFAATIPRKLVANGHPSVQQRKEMTEWFKKQVGTPIDDTVTLANTPSMQGDTTWIVAVWGKQNSVECGFVPEDRDKLAPLHMGSKVTFAGTLATGGVTAAIHLVVKDARVTK